MRPILLPLLVILTATGWLLSLGHEAIPAHATGRTGACTSADKNAVSVVIDYQDLGGGTAVYCASNLASGATGVDALAAIGVSYQGTSNGSGFVCRINGSPPPTQNITLPNGTTYQEKCLTTPPGNAYWSYWTAKPGGAWTYTTQGAFSRKVVFGTYEGWSFSLGGGIGQAPAPRVSPSAWVSVSTSSPPKPSTTAQPSQGSSQQTSPTPTRGSATSPSSVSTSSPGPSESDLGIASPGVSPTDEVSSPTLSSSTMAEEPTPSMSTDLGVATGELPQRGNDWSLILGVLLVVILAGATVAMSMRNRTR
jgi:hypothetical protein